MDAKHALTVGREPDEVYRFWRHFPNLPRFMKHVESVSGDTRRLHWVVRAPADRTVEWDAEVTEDRPNELIAWRSLEGADVDNAGIVRFDRAPGGRGTRVSVALRYEPPAGALGAVIATLFGEEPQWQVKDDLRRLKQVMEVGEVITTEGQSAGRESGTSPTFDSAVREEKAA